MSKQPFDLSYLKTHSTTRLSCCQCLIGNGFVSQWERESFFLTLVRMTGLVVSKANVIAKRANLFATVKRLRKTNCACRTTVLCTDTTCCICLLCPLRSMSANALRLRLSSLAVSCTRAGCKRSLPTMQSALSQVRHRSIKKKRTPMVRFILVWCG